MAWYRDSFPPLTLVDRYMRRIGVALAAMLAERSALHLCTEARAIHLRRRRLGRGRDHRSRRPREHPGRPLRRRRPGRPPALDAWRAQAGPDAGQLPDASCHAVGSRPIERRAQGSRSDPRRGRPAADPDPGRLAQRLFGGRRLPRIAGSRTPGQGADHHPAAARAAHLLSRSPGRARRPLRRRARRHLPTHPEGQSHGRAARLRPRDVAPDRAAPAHDARTAGRHHGHATPQLPTSSAQ